jgi:hypothetical protein
MEVAATSAKAIIKQETKVETRTAFIFVLFHGPDREYPAWLASSEAPVGREAKR